MGPERILNKTFISRKTEWQSVTGVRSSWACRKMWYHERRYRKPKGVQKDFGVKDPFEKKPRRIKRIFSIEQRAKE